MYSIFQYILPKNPLMLLLLRTTYIWHSCAAPCLIIPIACSFKFYIWLPLKLHLMGHRWQRIRNELPHELSQVVCNDECSRFTSGKSIILRYNENFISHLVKFCSSSFYLDIYLFIVRCGVVMHIKESKKREREKH